VVEEEEGFSSAAITWVGADVSADIFGGAAVTWEGAEGGTAAAVAEVGAAITGVGAEEREED